MKMRRKFVLALAVTLCSCGGSGSDQPNLSTEDGTGQEQDAPATPDGSLPGDVDEPQPVAMESQWISTSSGTAYAQVYKPSGCTKQSPCPAFVLVPDKDHAGIEEFACCAAKLANATGSIVVTYNPPGRGATGERSDGQEDFGGQAAQDALKDVANTVAKSTSVDSTNFGFVSLGNGLADAAGASARFSATALDFVTWLIDVEGPTNRCYITQSPFFVEEDEGWYINADGPGVSATRCDFDMYKRTEKFPAGTSSDGKGLDGTPNSYICHQNAFPIRQGGKPCDNDQWWAPREPKTYLKDLEIYYLRLQLLHDHEQPTRYAAREALRWVTQAETLGYQINNVNENNNLKGYSEDELEKAGAYLSYKGVGNGFGTDVYDTDGNFDKLSKEQLLTVVLPSFVKKMQERTLDR